jgi:ferredoxin
MNKYGNYFTVNTSNYLARIDKDKCKKCLKCVKKCPINIILTSDKGKKKKK